MSIQGNALGLALQNEIAFVDASVGRMVAELKKQGLYDSTLIVVTAKHGQSPVDTSLYKKNGSPNDSGLNLATCLGSRRTVRSDQPKMT